MIRPRARSTRPAEPGCRHCCAWLRRVVPATRPQGHRQPGDLSATFPGPSGLWFLCPCPLSPEKPPTPRRQPGSREILKKKRKREERFPAPGQVPRCPQRRRALQACPPLSVPALCRSGWAHGLLSPARRPPSELPEDISSGRPIAPALGGEQAWGKQPEAPTRACCICPAALQRGRGLTL